ncbi:MAG: VWA domain-containing protein, partial [Bacteroidota bacterium]
MDELLKYFHFLRPYWLLLIPLALLIYWRFKKNQSTEEKYKKLIAPHLLKHLIVGEKDKWKLEPMHMILTVLIIGTIAFAGPTWKRELPPFTEDKAPLTVVLSLSESIDAIDVSPTRLERAKQKIVELLKLRPGARSSLFVYAKEAFMVLPLTTDTRLIELYLNSLSTSLMPVDGSNTEAALNKVEEFLKEEKVPGTILLITDSIEKKAFNKFNEIKDSTNNQIIVLAAGTSKGGPIKVGKNRFKINRSGQRITPKLDINNFKELRDNYNIPVTTLSIENDDVEW